MIFNSSSFNQQLIIYKETFIIIKHYSLKLVKLVILIISVITLSTFINNSTVKANDTNSTTSVSSNNTNFNNNSTSDSNNIRSANNTYNSNEVHTETNVDNDRSNYDKTYQLKNPKKPVYLVTSKGQIIQRLTPKAIYHTASLESYQSELYKGQMPLSNFNNNLKTSGYVSLKDLKPVKTDQYYESPLAKQIRQLFPGTIHDQAFQRRVDVAPTIETPAIGDYSSDVEEDMSNKLPLSQIIMNEDYGPKSFKAAMKMTTQQNKELTNKITNSSNQQVFPLMKKEIIDQLKSNHQTLDDFNGYHIAVSVYPQHDKYYPYGFWILLNKPDTSSTNWTTKDVYNQINNKHQIKSGSQFDQNLNQAANDNFIIDKNGNVQNNTINRNLQKINKNYWAVINSVDLNKTNQLDSVAASFKIIANNEKNTGIALRVIPQKHQLVMLQVENSY